MANFTVQTPTLEADEAALVRLASFLSDLRPFWPVVRRLFISWMGRQFDSEGAYFGGGAGWVALSDEYAAWKSQVFPGKGILSAEGDLRRAATTPKSRPTPLTLTLLIEPYEKHADGEEGGKEIDPEWFQEGTNTMPARPLLFEELPPADAMAELEAAAHEYAQTIVVASGLGH